MHLSLADIRKAAGCWGNERWRTECALDALFCRLSGIRWQDLCNRRERLVPGGDAEARVCDWKWTSELTVCRVFPNVGGRLLHRCLRDWPFAWAGSVNRDSAGDVGISVILPVGGSVRHVTLMAVVRSFLSQGAGAPEIIVVEQGGNGSLRTMLPEGVRYVPVPGCGQDAEFNKSLLLNTGVRESTSSWVLLHDADIVVPKRYLEAILERTRGGEWDAIRPIRFLFYPGEASSSVFVETGRLPDAVHRVTQNFPGGSTAVRRDVYWELGGHDERFAGWGGEDTEFLDRLRTCRVYPGGFAPALHLWHAPADKKRTGDRNQKLQDERLSVPVEDRIRELRALLGPGSAGARV